MVGADTLVRIVSSKASIIEIVGHDVDENNIDTIEAFIRELQITIIIPLFRGYVASLKMLFQHFEKFCSHDICRATGVSLFCHRLTLCCIYRTDKLLQLFFCSDSFHIRNFKLVKNRIATRNESYRNF